MTIMVNSLHLNRKYFAFSVLFSFFILGTGLFMVTWKETKKESGPASLAFPTPPKTNILSILGVKPPSNYITLRIPILLYHYVENVQDRRDTIRISLNIPPHIFEEQLQTLKSAGYTFITPSDVDQIFAGKESLPQKPVILSFDDGYRDFYTDVFPLIKKYGVKVIAYIPPGLINHPNYMFSDQLKEISKSGLVEIGAHTVDHAYLKGVKADKAVYEIVESKKELESILNISVTSFAYPYGAFDTQAVTDVQNARFSNAVTTLPGIIASIENKYELFRIRPGGRVGNILLSYLQQDHFTPY